MAQKHGGRRLGRSISILTAATAGTLAVAVSPLAARADLVWDPNGATAGTGGAGTWDTVTPSWQDKATLAYQPWNNAAPQLAIFEGTGGAVAVDVPVTATSGLKFDVTGYSLGGAGPLTLGGTVTVASSTSAAINTPLAGSGAVSKSGSGTLTLGGNNSSWSGSLTIAGGTVVAAHSSALGTATSLTANATTTLELADGVSTPAGMLLICPSQGVGNLGGLRSRSGNTTWGGDFQTGAGAGRIGVDAGTLTLGGALTGAGSLSKQGAGTLVLASASTFTSSIFIPLGTLRVRHANALGTTLGNVVVNLTGRVELDAPGGAGGSMTIADGLELNSSAATGSLRNVNGNNTWSGGITMTVDTRIVAESGTLTLPQLSTSTVPAPNLTIGAGAGRVVLAESVPGSWGSTTVEGELEVKGASALGGSTAGTLIKPGGVLRLTNANVTNESLTIGDAVGTAMVRTTNEGQWTNSGGTATWTMANDAVLDAESGTFTAAPPVVGNNHTLTKRGAGNVFLSGGITGADRITVEQGTLFASSVSGAHATITSTGGVFAGLALLNGGTLASLSGSAAGQVGLASLTIPPAVAIDQAVNTTYGGVIEVSPGVAFTKTGVGTLTLTGRADGAVTAVNGGVIEADTSFGDSLDGIALGGGTFRALGEIELDGDVALNAGGGTFDTNAFVVTVDDIDGAGALTKTGDGTLRTDHVRTGSTLSVAGGRLTLLFGTSTAASVSLTGTGQIDLRSTNLITNSPAGTATAGVYTGVQGLVQKGRNGGAWNGAAAIITSRADAAFGLTSLGVATGAQVRGLGPAETATFDGQTITGASTIVMYTYAGDANLDGLISGDDYSAIDFAIATPGASGWVNGDFNYDGIISGDDYSAIDFNIVAQDVPFPTGGAAAMSGVTAVPEPAAAVLLTGALPFIQRRRRRQHTF